MRDKKPGSELAAWQYLLIFHFQKKAAPLKRKRLPRFGGKRE